MRKEIYLDNAATTPADKEVVSEMSEYWDKIYGNPSSFNDAGRTACKAVDNARLKIARILGAKPREIIFTGSATEANNLAVFGLVNLPSISSLLKREKKKVRLITTKIEHKSILEPFKKLEGFGYDATYLNVDRYGTINLEELKKSLKKNTLLVSVIYAHNEIGTIQSIKQIAKIIKEWRYKNKTDLPYFHTDACQAAGYLDINVNNLGVDLLTLNASKTYGPKGIGLLYIKGKTPIEPIILGGEQEQNKRAGTEAVPLIIGFAKALEIAEKNKTASDGKNIRKIIELRNYLIEKLSKEIPESVLNGPIPANKKTGQRLPNNINISIPNLESEQLLLQLDKYGIRASSGSACTSHDLEVSHVLKTLKLPKNLSKGSLRITLGKYTTKSELNYTVTALKKIIKKLRKIYTPNLQKIYYTK